MVAHDDGDVVGFGSGQGLFDAFAAAEVFDVNGVDFTAFDGVVDEVEVVGFRNGCFTAFFLCTEGEQNGSVGKFPANCVQGFADGFEGRDVL